MRFFLQLKRSSKSRYPDVALCKTLEQMGVNYRSCFQLHSKKLNSLSISTLYAVRLELPSILRSLKLAVTLTTFKSFQSLAKNTSWTIRCLSTDTDGVDTVIHIHKQIEERYYPYMKDIANKFVFFHQGSVKCRQLLVRLLASPIHVEVLKFTISSSFFFTCTIYIQSDL